MKRARINGDIKAKEVRLVTDDGTQKGVVSIEEALRLSEDANLDLVEVASQVSPPVCRLMDYGKYLYQMSKKDKKAKKNQKVIHVKEIKLRPKTDRHDYEYKVRHARDFLEEGNRVKVTIRFRGREVMHRKLGLDILEKIAQELDDLAKVDQQPEMLGKTLSMVLASRKI